MSGSVGFAVFNITGANPYKSVRWWGPMGGRPRDLGAITPLGPIHIKDLYENND